jgi:DNA polymerase III subunit epsilon
MFYWEIEKEVTRLKAVDQFDDALELLLGSIEFGENEARNTARRLYPHPYEEAAKIFRKLKRYNDEIYVLEKFLSNPKSISETKYSNVAERLEKACLLAGKAEKRKEETIEKVFYLPENVYFEERTLFILNGLIVDVETTGLDAIKDEIIELGAVLFSYNQMKKSAIRIDETYSGLREPTISIPVGASQVHGLKNKDVQGKSLDDAIIRRLFSSANFFIAHNVSFDRKFIRKLYPEVDEKNWYCSMNGINWKGIGHKSKGLQNLLSDYKIGTESQHRALGDTVSVYALLQQVNNVTGKTFLTELLSEFPEPKEDRESRLQKASTSIDIEVSFSKAKKSFWETLFGR